MAEYQKYTGDRTGLNVRTRGGRDPYKYSYAAPLMVKYLDSLSSVGGGGWGVGDISKDGGGKIPGHKSHRNGLDVDISLPLAGGVMSIEDKGKPEAVYEKSWGFKKANPDKLDIEKTIEFLGHAIENGATSIYLDQTHITKIETSLVKLSELPTISDSIKSQYKNMIKRLSHVSNHKDHFHVRLRGALSSKSGDMPDKHSDRSPEERKTGEDSDEREKSRAQFKRRLVPRKFSSSEEAAKRIYTDGDLREYFFGTWLKVGGMPEGTRGAIYKNIKNFNESEKDLDATTRDTLNKFIKRYVRKKHSLRDRYKSWRKLNQFIMTTPMQENKNKGNKMMKITRERLAKIIKEEVEAHKASQPNESIDVGEMDEFEAYIKEIADLLKMTYEQLFKGAAPTVGTPQTKADTGEDVTDDTAHEDAKEIILDLLGDAIDEFKQGPPEIHEYGHEDIPSVEENIDEQ